MNNSLNIVRVTLLQWLVLVLSVFSIFGTFQSGAEMDVNGFITVYATQMTE